MRTLLHVLTQTEDALAADIIAKQKTETENQVEVVDLTKDDADYKSLLEKIFAADSVQVW